MKSSEYWVERFTQLEEAQNQKGQDALKEMEHQYRQAQKQLEGQIARWYQRLAENNEISLAEARQFLKSADLKEFKWDVQDYIKYGRENAINQQWMKELENASAKYHISKLEALKVQTQQSFEALFAKQGKTITDTLSGVYESGFYHTAYELQRGFNIGWDIAALNQSQIEKVISKPWAVDGKNFSERIWGNKEKLIAEVHNELTQNIMLGSDPQKVIDALAKKMNTSKYNAGRLVMTEEAYFNSIAQKEAFEELGVEEYEIVATLDSKTSDICRGLDGQVFPMKDYQPGVTANPFHVGCRTTTAPHFSDDFGQIGERAARDANGKTYYVPSDMTYEDWKKRYVVDAVSDADKAMYERYKGVLRDLSPKSLEEFVKIKYNDNVAWEQLKKQYRVLNQYKIDSGNLSAQEILDLDKKIILEKRNNFSAKFRTSGNIAGAYIDNDTNIFYIAHSQINIDDDIIKAKYSGKATLVKLLEDRQFDYISVINENGEERTNTYFDTEAKLFEYLALKHRKEPFKTVTILSERGMCDSCLGVMKQFEKKFNVTVNAASNKKVSGNVWKHRMRKKK